MSEMKTSNTKLMMLLTYVAAATTVIAGILHIMMVPRSIPHNLSEGVLFLVGGILQIFWAVPVIKQWGRMWQIIGIIGTAVFVILFFSDRLHILPEGSVLGSAQVGGTSHGEFPRNVPKSSPGGFGIGFSGNSLLIEVCQITFIGLYTTLGKMISKRK